MLKNPVVWLFRALAAALLLVGLNTFAKAFAADPGTLVERIAASLVELASAVFVFLYPRRRSKRSLEDETKRTSLAAFVLDHGTDLVWWMGRDNKIIDTNDCLLTTLGWSRSDLQNRSVQTIDLGWVDAMAPELWSRATGGEAPQLETSLIAQSGSFVPCLAVLRYFRDQENEYLCVIASNISEQKRVTGALHEAQALFEGFLSGLPMGAFVRDRQGKFLYLNHRFSLWNPELTVGSYLDEVYTPAMSQLMADEDRAVLDQGPQLFTSESSSDGALRSFEIHKFPLSVPNRPRLVGGIVMDTTSRRKTELQMAESSAFLEAVINQTPVGILILDANTTHVVLCNGEAKALLGIGPDSELTGRAIHSDGLPWEILNHDGTVPILEQNPLYKAFFHQTSSKDSMLLRRTGYEDRFVLINSGPIYDAKGRFMAAIVAFLDVTELRLTQDRLQELNHTLEEIVQSRTRELSQSNEALKVMIENLHMTQDQLIESEKMASLGSLVAGVAHEINTPVGVSVTAASFLQERTQNLAVLQKEQTMRRSDLDSYVEQALQTSSLLLSNLERASNLIKSFKMISVDQSTDSVRLFKLKEYLDELFVSLHPPDKRVRVEVSVEGDPQLAVESYPGTFSQVVTNLFMNSCLHGFEGRTVGKVALDFRVSQDRLILRYRDDGKGMDEATLRRIYEPFFTTRRDLGGSGLGMNIVFNLVNQKLGGSIRANSSPNKGVEFVLDLPLAPPELVPPRI